MNIHIHPFLALIWIFTISAILMLLARTYRVPWAFDIWLLLAFWRGGMLFAASWFGAAEVYWWVYWVMQAFLHLAVASLAILFAIHCLSFQPRLPKTVQGNAMMMLAGIVLVITVAMRWRTAQDISAFFCGDLGAQVWVCGLTWIASICAYVAFDHGVEAEIIHGFTALYSVSMILAALHCFVPIAMPALWSLQMVAELGCIAWWGKAVTLR